MNISSNYITTTIDNKLLNIYNNLSKKQIYKRLNDLVYVECKSNIKLFKVYNIYLSKNIKLTISKHIHKIYKLNLDKINEYYLNKLNERQNKLNQIIKQEDESNIF